MRWFALCLVLTGCAQSSLNASSDHWRATNAAWCRSYGYTEGEPGWRECLMQVDVKRREMVSRTLSR